MAIDGQYYSIIFRNCRPQNGKNEKPTSILRRLHRFSHTLSINCRQYRTKTLPQGVCRHADVAKSQLVDLNNKLLVGIIRKKYAQSMVHVQPRTDENILLTITAVQSCFTFTAYCHYIWFSLQFYESSKWSFRIGGNRLNSNIQKLHLNATKISKLRSESQFPTQSVVPNHKSLKNKIKKMLLYKMR